MITTLAPFQAVMVETKPARAQRVRDDAAANGWRSLAAAVVMQALRDLHHMEPKTRTAALDWLLSDGWVWAEGLGIEPTGFICRVIELGIEGECQREPS